MASTGHGREAEQLAKVLDLLLGPYSRAMHDRHLAALEQLCRTPGFAVGDLPQAVRVAELAVGLCVQHSAFVPAASALLGCFGKPLRRCSARDDLQLADRLAPVFVLLAAVLRAPLPRQLLCSAAQAVKSLCAEAAAGPGQQQDRAGSPAAGAESVACRPPCISAAAPCSSYVRHLRRALDASGVVGDLVSALARALDDAASAAAAHGHLPAGGGATATTPASSGDHIPLVPELLRTLAAAARSHAACAQAVEAGALALTERALRGAGGAGALADAAEVVGPATQLLWNLLEEAPVEAARKLLQGSSRPPERDGKGDAGDAGERDVTGALVRTLTQRLLRLLPLERPSRDQAQARNDAAATLLLLARSAPATCATLPPTGALPAALAAVAAAGAARATLAWQRTTGGSSSSGGGGGGSGGCSGATDQELWQLLLGLCCEACAHDAACLEQCAACGLLPLLLSRCCCTDRGHATRASAGAAEALPPAMLTGGEQLRACWGLLQSVAPLCPRAFTGAGGPAAVASALREWGQGRDGCRALCSALGVARGVAAADAAAARALGEAGVVAAALHQLRDPAGDPELRGAALMALGALCGGCRSNLKRAREAGAADVLVAACRRLCGSGPGTQAVEALAVVGALRACLLPDVRMRAAWLVGGGLDALLAALAAGGGGGMLGLPLLTLLADVLRDRRSRSLALQWREDPAAGRGEGLGLVELLVGVWRSAAAREAAAGVSAAAAAAAPAALGVAEGVGGAAVAGPPAAAAVLAAWPRPPGPTGSLPVASPVATLDKVHACFAALGGCCEGERRPREARPTLAEIDAHAARRRGQAWSELATRLRREGVEPTGDDSARLATAIVEWQQATEGMQAAQRQALDALAAEAAAAEAAAYVKMLGHPTMEVWALRGVPLAV